MEAWLCTHNEASVPSSQAGATRHTFVGYLVVACPLPAAGWSYWCNNSRSRLADFSQDSSGQPARALDKPCMNWPLIPDSPDVTWLQESSPMTQKLCDLGLLGCPKLQGLWATPNPVSLLLAHLWINAQQPSHPEAWGSQGVWLCSQPRTVSTETFKRKGITTAPLSAAQKIKRKSLLITTPWLRSVLLICVFYIRSVGTKT